MKKKNLLVIIIITVLLIIGYTGIKLYQRLSYKLEPAVVVSESLKLKDVENFEIYQGTLISRQSVNIQPQVSGVISDIKVKPGDKVQKGQILIVIDPKKQEALLNSFKSQTSSLKTELETTKIQYERYTQLYERKTVSKQELENYKAAYEKAKSALDTNNAQIKEQAEQLKYHNIVAPFSGTVGDIPVKIGEMVSPENILLSVTQNETLELNVGVQAEYVYQLKKGLPVQILDYENKVITSSNISFVSPKIDSSTQTILAKAYFKNPDNILKADQTAKVKLIFNTEKSLLLPIGSTTHLGGADFAYTVKEENGVKIAHQIPISTGKIQDGKYVVKSGLKENDVVIIKGIQKLYEGAPIIEEGEDK